MNRTTIHRVTAALIAPLLLGVAGTARADWFGVSVGSGGFGLSVGVGDWAPYGDSWYDPSWSLDFHASLDGYGRWVWVDGLGEVWSPYVTTDWRPYTYGRWVYTSLGWTWVSYEPWGYLPHHYGEWAFTTFGWAWVPGYTFRPAHVVWVGSGDLVGWYPRGPVGWSHAHRGFWRGYDRGYRDGYRDGWREARYATYVPWKEITSDDVARAALDSRQVARSVTRASFMPMRTAPDLSEVNRRTGRPVPQVAVEQRQVSVDGRSVTIARPRGMTPSVSSHAEETVQRALTPAAAQRVSTRQQAGQSDRTPSVSTSRPASSEQTPAARQTTVSERGRSDTAVRPSQPASERSTGSSSRESASRERAPSVQPGASQTAFGERPAAAEPSRMTRSIAPQTEARQPSARASSATARSTGVQANTARTQAQAESSRAAATQPRVVTPRVDRSQPATARADAQRAATTAKPVSRSAPKPKATEDKETRPSPQPTPAEKPKTRG